VSYERNHLGMAEGYFINVQSRRYDSPGLAYAGAATGLVRIELARGDIEGAECHVNAARVFADETKSSMLQLASEAAARYLDIAVGRSLDASAAPPPVADFMHVAVSAPSHSWAWAALHCPAEGMSQAALDYIDAALRLAEEHGVTRIAIQLMVLRALALDARQDRDGATSVLAAALQRAAPLGLVRSFLDCGEGARILLQDVAQRHPDDNYAAMLIDAYATEEKPESGQAAPLTGGTAGTRGAVNSGGAAGIEQLTNREIDVLELLTKRFSNKEIARQLGVSASTIKTHTLNIYLKLGVKGRRQAAAEATKRNLAPN
jgi:ATP/maltotriose-dependent transcriptional regulator MalT